MHVFLLIDDIIDDDVVVVDSGFVIFVRETVTADLCVRAPDPKEEAEEL